MKLMRELRCYPAAGAPDVGPTFQSVKGQAGKPVPHAGPFWVLRATVEGPVQRQTGFLCDISRIDAMLRRLVVPRLRDPAAKWSGNIAGVANALRDAYRAAAPHCPPPATLDRLQLCLSPFLSLSVGDEDMVRLTQSFEFSAAHRLYCDGLSDEENRRLFGKCANPNGHGHNYVLEVIVVGRPDDATGTFVDRPQLERIVKERVIDHFDHKHLNLDCDEFRSLNPSVENIARVIWDRLAGAFKPGAFAGVRVWETPKTYAEYTGDRGT